MSQNSEAISEDPIDGTVANEINSQLVLDDLNHRILVTAKQLLENNPETCPDFSKINIDDAISNIDPKLWGSIMHITRSVSENRGSSKLHDESSKPYQLKKICCFFILSALIFCTDDRCSMFCIHC